MDRVRGTPRARRGTIESAYPRRIRNLLPAPENSARGLDLLRRAASPGDGSLRRPHLAPTAALSCLLFFAAQGQAVVIEDFEDGELSQYKLTDPDVEAEVTGGAAHDGLYGLEVESVWLSDWVYRDDAIVRLARGDRFSYWVQTGDGSWQRQYVGFGASSLGCYSVVLAANTGNFLLQYNPWFGFEDLAATPHSWELDHWYRVEVQWGAYGAITAYLYDENGTTLLNTVSATHTAISAGGIAFRGFNTGDVSGLDANQQYLTAALGRFVGIVDQHHVVAARLPRRAHADKPAASTRSSASGRWRRRPPRGARSRASMDHDRSSVSREPPAGNRVGRQTSRGRAAPGRRRDEGGGPPVLPGALKLELWIQNTGEGLHGALRSWYNA